MGEFVIVFAPDASDFFKFDVELIGNGLRILRVRPCGLCSCVGLPAWSVASAWSPASAWPSGLACEELSFEEPHAVKTAVRLRARARRIAVFLFCINTSMSKRFARRHARRKSRMRFLRCDPKVCGASTQTLRVKNQLIRVILHSVLHDMYD